ncbi:MAG: V-type ATPase subunit, partial [Clostridiales bacterium]|nr:V-type ATPase subunit [Clostridiales bacterium]
MHSDQLYANGRIAVMSTRLLTADKFTRLAECSTLIEALRVLTENGYGNGLTVT